MTQEEIDTLVNEAWLQGCEFGRMAEREKEKERQRYDIHSCGPDCDRYICVAVRKARQEERNRTWTQEHWTEYERSIAAAEREACAKVCEELETVNPAFVDMNYAEQCAAAIRARGETKPKASKDGVRELPAQSPRVETGPTRFGDDWCGVFIRGDSAFSYAMMLREIAEVLESSNERGMEAAAIRARGQN